MINDFYCGVCLMEGGEHNDAITLMYGFALCGAHAKDAPTIVREMRNRVGRMMN